MAQRRLQRELEELSNSPLDWATCSPVDNNLFLWDCVIQGPQDTPYAGGRFHMVLKVPNEYPFKPPDVNITTKVFHPNVNKDGDICARVLGENWSPQIKLKEVLLIIRQMFAEPSIESPLDEEAAQLFRTDRDAFNERVRDTVNRFARN